MGYAILILFVASMALMVNWAAAKRFQEIADMKGHNGEDYFGGASGWGFADGLWSWLYRTDGMDRQEPFSRTMTCLHYKEVSFHE